MEIYRREETVITLRAARAFRDTGIRYGTHKTMFIGSAILMVFGLTYPWALAYLTALMG